MNNIEQGRCLVLVRKKLNMTQKQMGRLLIGQDTQDPARSYQRWEAGTTPLVPAKRERLIEFLDSVAEVPSDLPLDIHAFVEEPFIGTMSFEEWAAMLERIRISPVSVIYRLHGDDAGPNVGHLSSDGTYTAGATKAFRLMPTTAWLTFVGPGGEELRVRVKSTGVMDAQVPSDWGLRRAGAPTAGQATPRKEPTPELVAALEKKTAEDRRQARQLHQQYIQSDEYKAGQWATLQEIAETLCPELVSHIVAHQVLSQPK